MSEASPDPQLPAIDTRTVLDALPDAVVVADRSNRILYVNRAAKRLLGWGEGTLPGRPLTTIIPERLRDRHVSGFTRYVTTGEAQLLGGPPVRLSALRADGGEVEVELSLSAHPLDGGDDVLLGVLRDLTDRVALERTQALTLYQAAMRAVASGLALAPEDAPVEEAGRIVLGAIGEALGWDVGALWVCEAGTLRPAVRWASARMDRAAEELTSDDQRFEPGTGLPGRVLATGEPAWVEEIATDANFPRAPLAARHGLHSGVAFPIGTDGDVVAVAELFTRRARAVEPDLLATLSAAGVEIGRFFERQAGRRRAEAANAHRIELAMALQASLLPPRLPVIPGVELSARYRAAAGEDTIGGDFFDVFPLPDGAWAVTIGDVCGRGPRAAALTALARYTVRAAAIGASRPSDVLRVLNDVVRRELDNDEHDERFLTVAFMALTPSPSGMRVDLATAGHPQPLVVRSNGALEEPPCEGGLVGAFEILEVVDCHLVLEPGDAIVTFTDGVVDGRGGSGDPFGEQRLRATLSSAAGSSAEDVAEAVHSALLDHLGDGGNDDLALVVVRLPADAAATTLTAGTAAGTA